MAKADQEYQVESAATGEESERLSLAYDRELIQIGD
jgi:hypothetical protein